MRRHLVPHTFYSCLEEIGSAAQFKAHLFRMQGQTANIRCAGCFCLVHVVRLIEFVYPLSVFTFSKVGESLICITYQLSTDCIRKFNNWFILYLVYKIFWNLFFPYIFFAQWKWNCLSLMFFFKDCLQLAFDLCPMIKL